MKLTMKTLFWKEWRESRLNYLFVLLLILFIKILLLYNARLYFFKSENLAFLIFAIIFCSAYGLILGLGTFAMEYTNHSITYLISRPITRKNIFIAKWLLSFAEIIGLAVYSWVLYCINFGPNPSFHGISPLIYLMILILIPIFVYIPSVFCSILLKDMTRATIGTFIIITLGLSIFRSLSDQSENWALKLIGSPENFINLLISVSPLSLILYLLLNMAFILFSYYLFSQQEM